MSYFPIPMTAMNLSSLVMAVRNTTKDIAKLSPHSTSASGTSTHTMNPNQWVPGWEQRAPSLLPIIGVFFTILVIVVAKYLGSSRSKLPPGPSGLPFLGNLHQITKAYWLDFTRFNKQYGPIVYLNFGGVPVILLGSLKATADLVDRRSAIYSGRPNNIVAGELLTGGMVFTMKPMNAFWKKSRRACHQALNKSICTQYQDVQSHETLITMSKILETPQDMASHISTGYSSIIIQILYGLPPLSRIPKENQGTENPEEDLTHRVHEFTNRALQASSPGAFFVEYFTWMMYLPRWITPWRVWAEEWFKRDEIVFNKLIGGVHDRMTNGTQAPCIARTLIESQETSGLSDKECAWTPATLYGGAIHTITLSTEWAFLALMAHPEVQKRAQAELDTVVGRERLPTFADSGNLPYIHAIYMEVFRWRPFGPVGMPHELEADDWYEGYYLPKGSMIIYNIWAIHRQESVYGPNTDDFIPDRFINSTTGQLNEPIKDSKDLNTFVFGFGRRICPGRHFALNGLFLMLARTLWAFSLAPEEGCPLPSLELEDQYAEGLANRPKPYNCQFTPRFPGVAKVIAQELEASTHA